LEGDRDKRGEQTHGKGTRHGTPVEVPQIGIMKELAEAPQVLVVTDFVRIREIAFYDPFRHSNNLRGRRW
jgi:hypothetical protein